MISDQWALDNQAENLENKAWELGDYTDKPCVNCSRHRVCECPNGKTRCEKCNWVEADREYCAKSL